MTWRRRLYLAVARWHDRLQAVAEIDVIIEAEMQNTTRRYHDHWETYAPTGRIRLSYRFPNDAAWRHTKWTY